MMTVRTAARISSTTTATSVLDACCRLVVLFLRLLLRITQQRRVGINYPDVGRVDGQVDGQELAEKPPGSDGSGRSRRADQFFNTCLICVLQHTWPHKLHWPNLIISIIPLFLCRTARVHKHTNGAAGFLSLTLLLVPFILRLLQLSPDHTASDMQCCATTSNPCAANDISV